MPTRREFLAGVGALALSASAAGSSRPPLRRGDRVDWAAVRREFLFPRSVGYFNTGTLGASPRRVVDATVRHLTWIEEHLPDHDSRTDPLPPLSGYAPFPEWREKMAEFVGADPDEIALTQNATMGMNFVANGLDLAEGDEVVTTDQEHVGGICPWRLQARRRGIVVREIPVGPPLNDPDEVVARFAAALTPRTRVLMVSHLTSALGLLLPARRLCALAREHGVLSVLDGAQVVGQLAINVKDLGCDFYVSSPHKWLLAPKGCGFLYVRRQHLERVWTTLASSAFENREWAAARLQQYGTGNMALPVGLMAAIDFQNEIGRPAVEARVRGLTARLREGLARLSRVQLPCTHPEMAAGVTTFAVEGHTGVAVEEALWTRRIRVRAVGQGAVRCGTHFYCQEEEVDRILEVIARLAA